jgi:septum formation protein
MYTRWLTFLKNKKIILASGSVQRKQLLSDLGLEFTIKTSDFPENLEKTDPKEYVGKTCLGKFEQFLETNSDLDFDILITADTIIEHNGTILEKPNNDSDIYEWFHRYSEDKVVCFTSVVVGIIKKNSQGKNEILQKIHFTTQSFVHFTKINDEMISDYIQTGEPYNRAGAFAIQGVGRVFIKKIEGCYFNIVGFPVQEFAENFVVLLKEVYGEDGWKQA